MYFCTLIREFKKNNDMAKVNVTLSLSSTDLFAKQTLSFTETDALTPVGDQLMIEHTYI